MEKQEQQNLVQLILGQRWATLATYDGKRPYASSVAYVPETDFKGFLIHVSKLASHTRYLLKYPDVSLAITQPDVGVDDPQTLARVSIQGKAEQIERGSLDYQASKERYLQRLPEAQRLFEFSDFILFRLLPVQLRFVAGFGRAVTVYPDSLVANF